MTRHRILIGMVAGALLSMRPGVGEAGVGVSGKIGTLGYGGDLTLGLAETLNTRLCYNTFNLDVNVHDSNDNNAENPDKIGVTFDWLSYGALLDWHPTGGGFRLSAGALINRNEIRLSAVPGHTVEINDAEYQVDSFDGSVKFAPVAPYVGIGVGNAVSEDGRFHLSFDLGVLFDGSPDVSLKATASDPVIQDRLNADLHEQADKYERDAKRFNWYPVLSLGVSFRF